MKMHKIPGAITYYMLKKFDPMTKTIKMHCGKVRVTRESVNDMLGLPMGGTKIDDLPFTTEHYLSFVEWTKQFRNNKNIRITDIKSKIVLTKEADMNFKLNFIAVMINSLIGTSSSQTNIHAIKFITKDTCIRDIDWCSMLIDSLVATKYAYDPLKPKNIFLGPSAYLAVCFNYKQSNKIIYDY
jgi:hypothetical protein